MVKPSVVSWTAVIVGFASSEGREEAALELFRHMQSARVRPHSLTVASVLSSCGELSALFLGREIHSHMIRLCMAEDS